MNLIGVDTAGPHIGVVVADEEGVRWRSGRLDRGAERVLVPWLHELRPAGLSGIEAVAVANGPGAFTGVRVGVATALGLALGLDIPVIPLLSLAPRAAAVGGGLVLSLLDARKGRMYAAWYEAGVLRGPVVDAPIDEVLQGVSAPFVATGEGALVCRAAIEAAGGRVFDRAEDPALSCLLTLAAQSADRAVPADQIIPFYLRDADAVPPRSAP
jgi:tRNA threonylcarbamoyladenosine biosynthesis protein TsaB